MTQSVYPPESSFSEGDRNLLSQYWHPVALSSDVGETRPFATRLLDVNLVLYRLGGLTVALDRCPHRGTRMSMGTIANGSLVCPYHGLEFNGRGICTRIPGESRATRIPDRFRIPTFMSQEAYGLIWVCLSGNPRCPIPDWSCLEREGNQRFSLQAVWNTSAPRQVENFNDLAHFATVHAATFGSAEHPEVPPYVVEQRPHGLYFDAIIPLVDATVQNVRAEYELAYPFATRLTLHYTRGIEYICDVASPIALGQTRVFLLLSRDHDQDRPLKEWRNFQETVNEEDRPMVESQIPLSLPLDTQMEWHLASDQFSAAFRQYWRDLGMSSSTQAVRLPEARLPRSAASTFNPDGRHP